MKRFTLIMISGLLTLLIGAESRAQSNTFWTGNAGNGLYSDSANWSNGVPNGNFNAFIDGGDAANSVVNQDIDAVLNLLDMSPGDALNINNGFRLTVNGSSIENNGQFNVNGSVLEIDNGATTLSGGPSSELFLNGGIITGATPSSGLINQGNIRGFGVIEGLVFGNAGEIAANNVGGALQIIMEQDFGNSGLLKSTGAGALDIIANGGSAQPITLFNAGGIIQADAATTVSIRDGVTVVGGTLQGAGIIVADGSEVGFGGIANKNLLSISDGSTAIFYGTINNTGRIVVNSTGSTTTFDSFGATLGGGGTIELVGSDAVINTSKVTISPEDFLISDNTILGGGSIRLPQFRNTGTIASAGVGNTLTIEAATVNNSGTIESRENSTLSFISTATDGGGNPDFMSINNVGGVIQAQNNSSVLLRRSKISGGIIRTTGTGKVKYDQTTLDGVTIDGFLTAENHADHLVLNNQINISSNGVLHSDQPGAADTGIYIVGSVNLSGNGEVQVNNDGGLTQRLTGGQSDLTSSVTIRNSAGRGWVASKNFTNNGMVTSDASGAEMIVANDAFTNNGTLRADAGEILVGNVSGGFTNYSAGVLTGGTYEVLNGGAIRVDNINVTTNRAAILLDGAGSALTDTATTPNNALRNLFLNDTIGSLSLANGATLSTANLLNRGLVLVDDDATLTIADDYEQSSGTTTVNGQLFASPIFLAGGVLNGDGSIGANLNNTAGTVAPGNSAGTLSILGDYSQGAGGTLEIELASLSSFDLLDDITATSLAGTLDIKLLNGYLPKVGDEFIILQTGTLTGSFSNVINPGSYIFDVNYFRDEAFVQLTVASVPEPSSAMLVAIAFGLVSLKRRRS